MTKYRSVIHLVGRHQWILRYFPASLHQTKANFVFRFSPDKKYLAVGYHESMVDIYDMNSKPSDLQRVAYYKFSSQSVAHMDFSADSKFIKVIIVLTELDWMKFVTSGFYKLI